MKHHSLTWRRVVVPAAFLAAAVCGAASPAQADAGPGHGSARGHAGPASSPASSRAHAANATAKSGDGATTFDKPNSWQAQADPDGSTNGGVDQPGGTGGTIDEQDGNNGSGNDIDCEDDNRGVGVPGHCKAKPHGLAGHQHSMPVHEASQPEQPNQPDQLSHSGPLPVPASPAAPAYRPEAVTAPVEQSRPMEPAAQILGISAVRPRNHPVRAEVAGIAATAPAASLRPSAQTLPNTGAPGLAVPLAGAGALLVAGGAGVMLRRRTATSRS